MATSLSNEAANNLQIQNAYRQNQERYIPLSLILETAIQRTYHQLMIMVDMFPETPDKERKIKIIAYACKTRQLFMRIYALVKFIRTAHINVSNILSFLDQQSFIFVDTADFLYNLAKVKLVNARLPSYSILTAVDVLTLGTYPRLPSCIKERILPVEKMTKEEKLQTLETLNRIIQCRLALSELPQQLKNFKIENGFVRFSVRDEFEARLTLISDDFQHPWRLLKLGILVKDANDPNRPLVNKFQTHHIHNIVQMKLNENNRPLVELYKSLHFFAHALQLEVLFDQMNVLNSLTMQRVFRIGEYLNWRKLTVKYWLDYSKTDYEFKFTVYISENSDYLQTSHHPPLHWRDHKEIDSIFKSGQLLIKTLVHHIIKFRSKKRLMEIQSTFDKIPYCKTTLIEEKPALKVQFFISKLENDAVWITIDYYSGLVQIFFPHSGSNSALKTSIENAFNSDVRKIEPSLLNLRVWLLLKRCETLIKTHGFKCFDDLSIVSFSHPQLSSLYSKLEKNRLFIELRKLDKIYIMVTIRTKDDIQKEEPGESIWNDPGDYFMDENGFCFNYYILNIAKCKFDGDLDPKQPFLRLISLSHFKKSSIVVAKSNSRVYKQQKSVESIKEETNPCILEFINMIYHIEERLPYLTLMSVLNKQNLVTQNIQTSPENIGMLSLTMLSSPPVLAAPGSDLITTVEHVELDRLSRQLNSLLISATIRQRGFKDYSNTVIPITTTGPLMKQPVFGMNSKMLFTLEFVFAHCRLMEKPNIDESEDPTPLYPPIDIHHTSLEAASLEALYASIRAEWISMCRMLALVKEIRAAFDTKPSEMIKHMRVKTMSLKKIVVSYGRSFAYTVQFQWSRESRSYEILLGVDNVATARSSVDTPLINYHNLLINEIRKHFGQNQSVVELVQLLNFTCVSVFGLAKLTNLPKFYSKAALAPLQSYCGFTLIVCSLTHFRLFYYSKYCLDVHVKANGLVSIRDGSFGLTDINTAIEELYPIQFLSGFLNMFLDENVQELLRRRASLVEDDNPDSPYNNSFSQQNQNQPMSQQQQTGPGSQSQSHVFLPPTSPAVVQSRATAAPTPSPVHHNYFAQSPGLASAPPSNAPAIARSPGTGSSANANSGGAMFGNFGSPAIPQSSPANPAQSQIITPNQPSSQASQSQPLSHQQHMIQSPSGFMSPATSNQQQNYATQSPASFSELSLQSPVLVKSPFVGPSPSMSVPSVPPSFGLGRDYLDEKSSRNQPVSMANMSNLTSLSSTSSLLFNYHQYKKCHSASIPIFLSEVGFLKMITVNPDTNYSPLEVFLASNHLKKLLVKALQSDNTFQVKNAENNVYKTYHVEFQVSNEISANYNAFSIQFSASDLAVDKLQAYFVSKILAPPYKFPSVISFFNMVSCHEMKLLKEFVQMLDYELNPTAFNFPWRLKWCWTIPYGCNIRTNKPHFSQFYQNALFGFQKKDKFYFILNFINQQRPTFLTLNSSTPFTNQNSVANIYLMCCYESGTNNFQFEILRQASENAHLVTQYENCINMLINAVRQRDINNYSLITIVNDLLYSLPPIMR